MSDKKFCQHCGTSVLKSAVICVSCGSKVGSYQGSKDRVTTALLALFLGAFGVHRFYLGQTVIGLIYLFTFWTFIPAIIAFIEFIVFLTMSDENFNEKYNT